MRWAMMVQEETLEQSIILLQDYFTASDNTPIVGRMPDVGNVWTLFDTQQYLQTGTEGRIINNKLQTFTNGDPNTAYWGYQRTLSDLKYTGNTTVKCKFTLSPIASNSSQGIYLNADHINLFPFYIFQFTANRLYLGEYTESNGLIRTELAVTLTAGNTYDLTLIRYGGTLYASLGGYVISHALQYYTNPNRTNFGTMLIKPGNLSSSNIDNLLVTKFVQITTPPQVLDTFTDANNTPIGDRTTEVGNVTWIDSTNEGVLEIYNNSAMIPISNNSNRTAAAVFDDGSNNYALRADVVLDRSGTRGSQILFRVENVDLLDRSHYQVQVSPNGTTNFIVYLYKFINNTYILVTTVNLPSYYADGTICTLIIRDSGTYIDVSATVGETTVSIARQTTNLLTLSTKKGIRLIQDASFDRGLCAINSIEVNYPSTYTFV